MKNISRGSCPLEIPTYKPSAYYFREALREAGTKAQAVSIGMQAVRELENIKKQMRDAGLEPQPRFILSTEVGAKDFSPMRRERLRLVCAEPHSELVTITGCEVRHV